MYVCELNFEENKIRRRKYNTHIIVMSHHPPSILRKYYLCYTKTEVHMSKSFNLLLLDAKKTTLLPASFSTLNLPEKSIPSSR